MISEQDKFRILLGHITASAWADADYKKALIDNPAAALSSSGLQPPPGLEVRVHVDTATLTHIICNPQWLATGDDIAERLRSDPNNTLASLGMTVHEGMQYSVLFNSNTQMNIIIPLPPNNTECGIVRLR